MPSGEELRTESRRLIALAKATLAPELKCNIASRGLGLSQRAELIEMAKNNPEMLERYIRRCQYALAGGLSDKAHREMLEHVISDLSEVLNEIRKRKRAMRAPLSREASRNVRHQTSAS